MQETFCGHNYEWCNLAGDSKPSIGRLNCLAYNHTPITVISDPATLPFMFHYHIRIGFNHTKCMHEWMRPSSSQISQQKVSMVRFTGVISNWPNRILHWKRKRFQISNSQVKLLLLGQFEYVLITSSVSPITKTSWFMITFLRFLYKRYDYPKIHLIMNQYFV